MPDKYTVMIEKAKAAVTEMFATPGAMIDEYGEDWADDEDNDEGWHHRMLDAYHPDNRLTYHRDGRDYPDESDWGSLVSIVIFAKESDHPEWAVVILKVANEQWESKESEGEKSREDAIAYLEKVQRIS